MKKKFLSLAISLIALSTLFAFPPLHCHLRLVDDCPGGSCFWAGEECAIGIIWSGLPPFQVPTVVCDCQADEFEGGN